MVDQGSDMQEERLSCVGNGPVRPFPWIMDQGSISPSLLVTYLFVSFVDSLVGRGERRVGPGNKVVGPPLTGGKSASTPGSSPELLKKHHIKFEPIYPSSLDFAVSPRSENQVWVGRCSLWSVMEETASQALP